MHTKAIGNRGEDKAITYLTEKGYIIKARNWRSSHKEIDIIAQQNEYIVFFEVKTRKKREYLHPVEVFSKRQQKNIIECASMYLYQENLLEYAVRFDLLCIVSSTCSVMHWENVISL